MEVKDLHELVNSATKMAIGETELLKEDLSNLVDVGNAVFNAKKVDCFVNALIDRIGRTYYKDRRFSPELVSLFFSNWDYGSVMQTIGAALPEVTKDDSYSLTDGNDYPVTTFHKPTVYVKYYDKSGNYQIVSSYPRSQVQMAFTNPEEMNKFIALLRIQVDNALSIAFQDLAKGCINNMIANTVWSDYKTASGSSTVLGDLTAKSGTKAVNLLYLYNTEKGTKLTADKALSDMDFLKFAAFTIKEYASKLPQPSELFNIEGKTKFTGKDNLDIKLLSTFANACDCYLQADTFHDTLTALPKAEKVTYWQGTGKDFKFGNTSKIQVTAVESESATGSVTHDVTVTGILGIMYDHLALGCNAEKELITTEYNANGNFDNYWYKRYYSWFNDFSENFVVFFIA